MPSKVFFGSARQARLEAKETLPAKLDLILEQLHLRDRVNKETVVIKMHTGNNMVYSTIHPVFVRRVVQAIKDGGGKPFVVDVNWDTAGAETRGYASEVIGCPVYPAAGPDEKYFYEHERPYKSIQTWKIAGLIQEAHKAALIVLNKWDLVAEEGRSDSSLLKEHVEQSHGQPGPQRESKAHRSELPGRGDAFAPTGTDYTR
jgi:uncharacterized Fe-S center protein